MNKNYKDIVDLTYQESFSKTEERLLREIDDYAEVMCSENEDEMKEIEFYMIAFKKLFSSLKDFCDDIG